MKFALATTLFAVAASAASAADIATVATAVATAAASAADIPTVATSDGRFKTLVAALTAADLVETLSGEGPFTVFAPVDDAFAALPAGLVDCLLLPDNKEVLTTILTYHVADGKVMSTDLTDGQEIPTLQKDTVTISIDGETVKVNDATVIVANVEASNGVIHAIDGVLLPPGVDATEFLASDACAAKPDETTPETPDEPAETTPAETKAPAATPAATPPADTTSADAGDDDSTSGDSGAALLSVSAAMVGVGLVTAFL